MDTKVVVSLDSYEGPLTFSLSDGRRFADGTAGIKAALIQEQVWHVEGLEPGSEGSLPAAISSSEEPFEESIEMLSSHFPDLGPGILK